MTLEPTKEASKLRVLHVITSLSTGGAEMMLLNLLSETRGKFWQTVISLKDEGTLGARIKGLGVPLHSVHLNPALPNPFRLRSLRAVVRQFQPDVIQGWMYHGNVMATYASTLLDPHPPVIWDVQQSVRHVADYGRATAMVIRLGARLSRHPARIIYVSQIGARQHAALGYRPEKEIVIPNGVDCQTFHPDTEARQWIRAELGIAPEQVLVGLVARYHPMKNHAGFLAAAAQLARSHPATRFLLAGKGVTLEQPALRNLVDQHQLQDCVFLLGERHDTPRLTAAFDIACSASAWGEAFSVAIGEAMASGVPCVVTDVGDSSYLVGDTGLSVAPGNPAALAEAVAQLVDAGIESRQRMGMAARARVEREFSLAAIAGRYEELYREIASHHSALTTKSIQAPAIASRQKSGASDVHPPLGESLRLQPGRPVTASPMRILHVITDLDTGGAQMMLLKLLSATHCSHSHAVIALKNEDTIGPRIQELGIPIHQLGLRPLIPNPMSVLSTRSLVRRYEPHIIQGWMYHGNLMASLAGKLSGNGVPVLWNIRQSLEDIADYRWRTAAVIRLGAIFSGQPQAIIYNSSSGAKHHEHFGYRNPKQILIPNGFDCEIFRQDELARNRIRRELKIGDDAILIGLVARYDPMKDHRGFLQAAAGVARTHHNARFVLVGKGLTGDRAAVMELIAQESLQEKVFLLGERLDIHHVTCAFDIACSASWSEGFSNAIGEAMACGVPCVVTDVGDSAYLLSNTGITVPPRLPGAMAEAIGKLIDAGGNHRRQLGAAARQRIENEFSLPSIARHYENLYQSITRRTD